MRKTLIWVSVNIITLYSWQNYTTLKRRLCISPIMMHYEKPRHRLESCCCWRPLWFVYVWFSTCSKLGLDVHAVVYLFLVNANSLGFSHNVQVLLLRMWWDCLRSEVWLSSRSYWKQQMNWCTPMWLFPFKIWTQCSFSSHRIPKCNHLHCSVHSVLQTVTNAIQETLMSLPIAKQKHTHTRACTHTLVKTGVCECVTQYSLPLFTCPHVSICSTEDRPDAIKRLFAHSLGSDSTPNWIHWQITFGLRTG